MGYFNRKVNFISVPGFRSVFILASLNAGVTQAATLMLTDLFTELK